MFEAAELGRERSQEEWKEAVPELRSRLLEGQFALRKTKQSVKYGTQFILHILLILQKY